jgi:hypothetical protein
LGLKSFFDIFSNFGFLVVWPSLLKASSSLGPVGALVDGAATLAGLAERSRFAGTDVESIAVCSDFTGVSLAMMI